MLNVPCHGPKTGGAAQSDPALCNWVNVGEDSVLQQHSVAGEELTRFSKRWMEAMEKKRKPWKKKPGFQPEKCINQICFRFFLAAKILMVIQQNGGIMASVWMQYVLGI